MASLVPLTLKSGVDVEKTPLLAEASWVKTGLVRFFNGLLQKIGGWSRLNGNTVAGICRGILPWADTLGTQYIAEGTEQRLYVTNSGILYDITPVDVTSNLPTPLTTTELSATVQITDAVNGSSAAVGNWVNFPFSVSVDTLLLYGAYQITNVIDSSNYTIEAASAATNSATGGVTPKFTTVLSSATVTVTLDNHGLAADDVFTVVLPTTVGGITLSGEYLVSAYIDTSNFTITASSPALADDSAFENSGDVQIQYYIPNGAATSVLSGGYGLGAYGFGAYGFGAASPTVIRQWSLVAFGSYLIASPTNGPLYLWIPSGGLLNNPATLIPSAPAFNTQIILAMPQQQIMAFGSEDSVTGLQDPMLVRWCDVGDYTVWTASSLNQAGSFRLSRGSRIVGGIQANNQILIFTDVGLWSAQYIGYPLVYGFTELGVGCGLLSMRSVMILGDKVLWASKDGFFMFSNGAITPIPCAVWDKFYGNLNTDQVDKVTAAPNSSFNEGGWYFPSASGSGENDSNVRININDGSWTYDEGTDSQSYIRTAWYDQSVVGQPIGVDLSGLIQQHETSVDADGVAITSKARTGWFKLQNGEAYISIERIIPDFVLQGTNASVTMTLYVVDYPWETPRTCGPYTVTANTKYFIVRGRGRLASVEVECNAMGTFWRMGSPLVKTIQSGAR